jgi:hypothetical protein
MDFAQLRNAIAGEIRGGINEIDMLAWLTRASLEFMGRAGIGYNFGALKPGTVDDEYTVAIKNLLQVFYPPMQAKHD